MSVYIKGMTIPPEGEYRMTLYVCPDGSAYIDVASFPVDKDRFEAVPVPEHGRLIDGDRLAEIHREGADKGDSAWKFHVTAKAWVDEMPTIIPADKET